MQHNTLAIWEHYLDSVKSVLLDDKSNSFKFFQFLKFLKFAKSVVKWIKRSSPLSTAQFIPCAFMISIGLNRPLKIVHLPFGVIIWLSNNSTCMFDRMYNLKWAMLFLERKSQWKSQIQNMRSWNTTSLSLKTTWLKPRSMHTVL